MKNMKKRVASTALAGAMALSLAATAFAAANETVIAGTYTPITLAVTVPTTGKAVINPYGLPYKIGDVTISGQQITTAAPLTIQNKSAVALAVKAKVTGTASDGVTLDTADASTDYSDADAGVTTKNLSVKFQAFAAPTLDTETLADTAALNEAFAALEDGDAALTAQVVSYGADETVPDATGSLVLREGNEEGALQPGGAAFFRLTGQAAKKAEWAKTDTFSATVAFTFTPSSYVADGGTLSAAGGATSVAEGAQLEITLALPAGVRADVKTIKFETSDTKGVNLTVADNSSTATAIKGKVTGVAEVNTAKKVWVTFTGTDGITYKSNELSLKVTAAAGG